VLYTKWDSFLKIFDLLTWQFSAKKFIYSVVYGSFKMESGTFFKLEPLFFGNWNIPMFMICIFYSSLICSFSFFLVPACDEHIPGTSNKKYLFSVTLLPNSGLCFLVVEVSRSCTVRHTHTHTHPPIHPPPTHTHTHPPPLPHTHTHTHSHTHPPPPLPHTHTQPVALFWMRYQTVIGAATYWT